MRIVTRPDFDGIVCAVLLSDALKVETPIKWVEPNAMQHGLIQIQEDDVIANLAYNPKCALWFDHHESNRTEVSFNGVFKIAPSAAGIIYQYFNEHTDYTTPFSRNYNQLVEETDKIDSANLSLEEVLHPEKYPYVALSSTICSHNPADEHYWNKLVKLLRTKNITEILDDKDVKARIKRSSNADKRYREFLEKHTTQHEHVTITDFRNLEKTPSGNRFLVFSLFPDSVVNVKIRYENKHHEKVVLSVGHSIFNRNCQVSAGEICSYFGGGGHRGAGSCSVSADQAEQALATMLDILLKNQPSSFPILFEDHFFIAADKPPGLLSEGKRIVNYKGQLFPVFVLEQNISGIVLFAKNEKVGKVLSQQAKDIGIKRLFYTIVNGLPKVNEGTITDWQSRADNPGQHHNSPVTKYWQVNSYNHHALLELETTPWDNNQILAHMNQLGCPIVGDIEKNVNENPMNRLALHAYFLAFTHPVTQERIVIETPIPQSFLSYCNKLKV